MAAAQGWTIGSLLETAAAYLHRKGSESARLDAELLLAEALGVERVQLYTEFDRPLAKSEVNRYRSLIARRATHEPVAYILGRAYFRRLRLQVTPDVLIPRPETEELVDVALALLRRRPLWRKDVAAPQVADVGTGSGAVALSLAQEAGVRVLATDASSRALRVAARNATAAGLEDLVEFRCTDLLSDVPAGSLSLIVSNPPYVRSSDLPQLQPDIRLFEPGSALEAGSDGLAVVRRLLPQAAHALRPGGSIVIEVGQGQAAAVAQLARAAGFCLVQVHKDLSQKDRIVEATLPGVLEVALTEVEESNVAVLQEALRAGAVVGLPTDTVYGIAARWDSPAGVRELFRAKGRSPDRPVAVMFASVDSIKEALPDLSATCFRILEALLPGPLTFVVSTKVPRPELVGTPDSLGVRVPDHPLLAQLLRVLDTPLAATSANPTGGKEPGSLSEVDQALLAHCSVAFAMPDTRPPGWAMAGKSSTVVDLRPLGSGGAPQIIREGAVPATTVLRSIHALL